MQTEGLRALGLAACLATLWASTAEGQSTYSVVRERFADEVDELHVNRKRQVIGFYEHGYHNYRFYTYTPDGSLDDRPVPSGCRPLEYSVSDWGIALETDHNGFTPMEIWSAAIGSDLQLLMTGTPNGSFSGFGARGNINDSGVIGWTGRDLNAYPVRDVYRWQPGMSPGMLSGLDITSADGPVLVDPAGRMVLRLSVKEGEQTVSGMFRHTPGSGWENLTRNVPDQPGWFPGAWSMNPSGQIVFPSRITDGGNNRYRLNLYTEGAGIVEILDNTDATGRSRTALVGLSDSGDVLIRRDGFHSSDPWEALLRKADGTLVNLADVLPAGKTLPWCPDASMNHVGHVALWARDEATGGREFYLYDGTTTTLILDGPVTGSVARFVLDDLRRLYFCFDDGGRYSLAFVPEPGAFEVAIDIRPRSDPNRINLRGNGALPVAIMGSEEFDVHDVDQPSLELQGAAAEEKGKSGTIGALKDIDRDGFLDLVIHFCMSEMELDPDATEAELTGLLLDGTGIFGTDAVWLVGGGKGIDGATLQYTPEPATLVLLGIGGLALLKRRSQRRAARLEVRG